MSRLVTIAIPVYRRLNYLPGVLSAVALQNYDEIELIVSDNGQNGTAVEDRPAALSSPLSASTDWSDGRYSQSFPPKCWTKRRGRGAVAFSTNCTFQYTGTRAATDFRCVPSGATDIKLFLKFLDMTR